MPLCDLTADMRIMRVASGSHVDGSLGARSISNEAEANLSQYVRAENISTGRNTRTCIPAFGHSALAMRAGDDNVSTPGGTLHCAAANVGAACDRR